MCGRLRQFGEEKAEAVTAVNAMIIVPIAAAAALGRKHQARLSGDTKWPSG